MADDPDREIREACNLHNWKHDRPVTLEDLAAGLIALRRVLERDLGGVPEGWRQTRWVDDNTSNGGLIWQEEAGDGFSASLQIGGGIGVYPTLAAAAAAVAAARRQP